MPTKIITGGVFTNKVPGLLRFNLRDQLKFNELFLFRNGTSLYVI